MTELPWRGDHPCFPTFKPQSRIEPAPVESAILLTAALTDAPLPPPPPSLCPEVRATTTRVAELHGRALIGLLKAPRVGGGNDWFLLLSWQWTDSILLSSIHTGHLIRSEEGGAEYEYEWVGDSAIQASWRNPEAGPGLLCRLRKDTIVLLYSKLPKEMRGCLGARRVGGTLRFLTPSNLLLYVRL
jgi:hypothetical protein